jgi:hypothetical protein
LPVWRLGSLPGAYDCPATALLDRFSDRDAPPLERIRCLGCSLELGNGPLVEPGERRPGEPRAHDQPFVGERIEQHRERGRILGAGELESCIRADGVVVVLETRAGLR